MKRNDMTKVFTSEKFGSVRTVEIKGEPWFVGKDIADALGYTDVNHSILDHVDSDDRVNSKTQGQNDPQFGQRGLWLINESGLYSLVLSSKLPTAKEFKRWVTKDVLPSIRKTGSYTMELPYDYLSALEALVTTEKARQLAESQVKLMQPKADFYDTVASSDSLLSMADVAKVLDMGIGRNKLYKLLRDRGILQDTNVPYQRFVDAGYFKLVESTYVAGENQVVATTTYVRQKGVDYIRKLLTTSEF